MIKRILIIIILVLISSICVGIMDSIQFHYDTSIPARKGWSEDYWKASDSWKNKYKKDNEGNFLPAPENWYYKTFNISYKEKFPLSATLLVAFTDAWHLLKTIAEASTRTIIVLLGLWLWGDLWNRKKKWLYGTLAWIGIFIIQSIGFHLTYTLL